MYKIPFVPFVSIFFPFVHLKCIFLLLILKQDFFWSFVTFFKQGGSEKKCQMSKRKIFRTFGAKKKNSAPSAPYFFSRPALEFYPHFLRMASRFLPFRISPFREIPIQNSPPPGSVGKAGLVEFRIWHTNHQ